MHRVAHNRRALHTDLTLNWAVPAPVKHFWSIQTDSEYSLGKKQLCELLLSYSKFAWFSRSGLLKYLDMRSDSKCRIIYRNKVVMTFKVLSYHFSGTCAMWNAAMNFAEWFYCTHARTHTPNTTILTGYWEGSPSKYFPSAPMHLRQKCYTAGNICGTLFSAVFTFFMS
jgi:hypothetical protein